MQEELFAAAPSIIPSALSEHTEHAKHTKHILIIPCPREGNAVMMTLMRRVIILQIRIQEENIVV